MNYGIRPATGENENRRFDTLPRWKLLNIISKEIPANFRNLDFPQFITGSPTTGGITSNILK
jgi:hypothetical protein